MAKSSLEDQFAFYWRTYAPTSPKPARDYRFCAERKFTLDFAWPSKKIYVECQGGVYQRMGHSTGKGIERDYEKHNLLTDLGWRGYYFTRGPLEADPIRCIHGVRNQVDPLPFAELPEPED